LIASLRHRFNESFTPAKYEHFLSLIEERTGIPARFRLSETPVFLPRTLVQKMAVYGREMVESLLANESYMRVSDASIPPQFRVPNEANHPLFIQVDFGLDENLEPKLVEIQGFPSLYAFQPVLAESYADAYGIDLHRDGQYEHVLRDAIVGDHDPNEVILLEIDPANQKTYADFVLTEKICGIRTVDIRDLKKEGNRLTWGDGIPVRRIYNRAIVDELVRRDIALAFDWRDDLDVEWAGHPNWFFRLSKFSLPFLKHVAVPETRFVDDLTTPVDDPENWVLKPLYSFAGLGVVVGPTRDQIEAAKGNGFVLQRRVNFRPVIETPYGKTKIEIRMMYNWRETFDFVNIIVRSGRGAQMGVDFNKGLEWVGASAAFTV
jgi:hypothetical protein